MKDKRLTRNFKLSEFQCRCGCGFGMNDGDLNLRLVHALQELRDIIGKPVKVSSGCRCPARNRAVGGVRNSQHLIGNAADIKVDGLTGQDLLEVAQQIDAFYYGGIGKYTTWVHVDVRGTMARWSGL